MSGEGGLDDEELDEIAERLAERLRTGGHSTEDGDGPSTNGASAGETDGPAVDGDPAGRGGTDLWDRIARSLAPDVDEVADHAGRPAGPAFGDTDTGHGVVLPEHADAPTVLFEAEVTEDGRVPVPDRETETLDLSPGDTVTVTMSARE